ncbi:MAG: hypothetical protein J6Q71_00480 [Bacteroidales bacterium]|nr:hypothetical protein [Bacteroidales bacterium]
MEKSQIWKASVSKAFYGFLAYKLLGGVVGAIVGLASGAAGVASIINGGGGGALLGPVLVGILALAGYVYYFLGIKGMKESAAETPMGDGTAKVYKGAMLGLVGTLIGIIPLLGFIGTILEIIGFVFMMMGFNSLRQLSLNELAAKGAHQLWLMMVLSVVSAVVSIIPLVGNILSLILSIVILALAFLGWRNFANSSLE